MKKNESEAEAPRAGAGSKAPALERGLAALDMIATADKPLSFNNIATHLNIPLASVSRILQVLVKYRYLQRDPETGSFAPGMQLIRLADVRYIPLAMKSRGTLILSRLSNHTQCTAVLFSWQGHATLIVDRVQANGSLAMNAPDNHLRHNLLHFTWGWFRYWTMSAKLCQEELTHYTDADAILSRGAVMRRHFLKHGFTIDRVECIRYLAAPVTDAAGQCIGALVLYGLTDRVPKDREMEIGQVVRHYADELSLMLGCPRNSLDSLRRQLKGKKTCERTNTGAA